MMWPHNSHVNLGINIFEEMHFFALRKTFTLGDMDYLTVIKS